MALEIRTARAQQDAAQVSSAMRADRPLWLNAEKTEVVEDGSGAAAFLFAPAGDAIHPADANRYGLSLVEGKVVLPGGSAEQEPAAEPPAPPAPAANEPAP